MKAKNTPPFSLSIKGASEHFGLQPKTLYNWISNGRLAIGVHYLKVSNKPLIIRDAFINWMKEESNVN